MTSQLIRTENLKKHYTTGGFLDRLLGNESTVKAVDGVDLAIPEGETLGVVGESGCGKTTLGETLVRLSDPTSGRIHFDGDDITATSSRNFRPYRKRMQIIFQNPQSNLDPRMTIGEIIEEPMDRLGTPGDESKEERAKHLLEQVGLDPASYDRYPHEFSGGQRQRIGIARALSVDPDFVVCDEPVSALDVSIQVQILNLLKDLQDEFGLTYLFISHDLSVVRYISDRIAVMYLGEIVERGDSEDVFEHPQHPYTQALLSAIPRLDVETSRDRILLEGTPPSPENPPSGCSFHPRCQEKIGEVCEEAPPEFYPAGEAEHEAACYLLDEEVASSRTMAPADE